MNNRVYQVTTLLLGAWTMTAREAGKVRLARMRPWLAPSLLAFCLPFLCAGVAHSQNITTSAGNGTGGYSGDGGLATSGELHIPYGVAVDASGNIYIADDINERIRKVTIATGDISTIAGNGTQGYSGDGGLAINAELSGPQSVAVDSSGNVYIADTANQRIRKVSAATGDISTIAGIGTSGYAGDGGLATSAELLNPQGVAVDATGNIYIADSGNSRVRKISASTGDISTIAGNGTSGSSGDGGLATSAELNFPTAVTVDASGNLYIADEGNSRVRKITASTGDISTIAGNGTRGYSGDGGLATSAELTFPYGVAIDASGNVYIADEGNNRIRKVTASTGDISTIAGNGTGGSTGDGGLATSAELHVPYGVALDSSANVYIADSTNNRIRCVQVSPSTITTVSSSNSSLYQGATFNLTASVRSGCGTPTGGTVTFYANGTSIGSQTLASGSATVAINSLTVGSYTITADYGGHAPYQLSNSSGITQTITTVPTGIVPSMSSPATYGTSVPLSWTVTAANSQTPTGTVTVVADGSNTLCTQALSGGAGSCSESALGTGTHSIVFNYAGTALYASASDTVPLTIQQATPTLSWATPSAITYGTALSGTQLNASSGGVAGTFSYSPASGAILNAGTQTLSVTFTPSDTTNYRTATGSVSLIVNKAATTISITSTLNPTTYGQNVSWPFTLSTAYGTIPSGDQIVYYANSAAQFNTSVGGPAWGGYGLNAGTFNIYAAFQGDANYLPSSSNTVSQVVNKATPTVYFTTDSPVTYGTPLIVDVFVSCGNACGNVDYRWDGSEWGTVPLDSTGDYAASRSPTDAAGTHTVQVNYLGDANHNAVNTTAQTVTINKAPTVAELTSSVNPLVAGATTTLSTLVDTGGAEPPTGTVTWTSNGTAVGSSSVSTVTTTNLVPYSNGFTSSTWAGYCGTEGNVTPNTTDVAGPDGTNTSTKIVTTANVCVNGQASGFVSAIPAGLTAGQSYVVSVWLRGGSGGESINFGLNDCASTTISLTTSWKRYSIAYSTIASGVSSCGTGPRGFQVLENGIGTVYLWGAQTEQASALGPYVATGNGAATGSGGVAQLATSGLVGGSDALVATYSGDSNDLPSTSPTVTEVVNKATPTITWATPAAVTYGTALSATQLNASSGGIAGTFAYTPASGTILNAGTQTLSVTFTPTDTTDYNTVTAGVSLVVNKATPTISLTLSSTTPTFGDTISATISVNCGNSCGAGSYIIDGTNTGNVTLSSGGSYVAGINVASAGTHTVQAQVVGNSNYNSALTAVQTVTVAKATPTITWADPAAITYGTALTSTQLNGSSGTAGSLVYTPSAGTILTAGTRTLSVTLTPTDTTDYNTTTQTVSLVVNKATPSITWATPSAITYGTALTATQLNASSGGIAGSLLYAPAAGAVLNAGTQTLSVTFTPTDTTDYNTATSTVALTVNKAPVTILISSSENPSIYGDRISVSAAVTGSGGVPTGTVTFTDGGTTVGTGIINGSGVSTISLSTLGTGSHALTATYSGDSNFY